MKTKLMMSIVVLMMPLKNYAQTQLNKSIPVQPGKKISMNFDYPQLVRVSTWDKNEVSVQGTITINGGENDDAFIFESAVNGNIIDIRSTVKDIKKLPQRITINRDGQKIMFRDKAELKKYQQEHGASYNNMSWGADIDIELVIKVPRNVETNIKSVYGMVEIVDFSGPVMVESTYGGVDATLTERAAGEITAETNYGEIFTNLEAKFASNSVSEKDFHAYVIAKPGTGPRYSFESKYGNVYIRKAQ